jgi:hypothetical protein
LWAPPPHICTRISYFFISFCLGVYSNSRSPFLLLLRPIGSIIFGFNTQLLSPRSVPFPIRRIQKPSPAT